MSDKLTEINECNYLHVGNYLHVVRNPHGYSDDVVRDARLIIADEYERLWKELAQRDATILAQQATIEKQRIFIVEHCYHDGEFDEIHFQDDLSALAAHDAEKDKTIETRQAQVAMMREALELIVHDALCMPKERKDLRPYHRVAEEALSAELKLIEKVI
jgi:hypothetical protein